MVKGKFVEKEKKYFFLAHLSRKLVYRVRTGLKSTLEGFLEKFLNLEGFLEKYLNLGFLEKSLNLEGFLEKSLKIKAALKSTGKSLKSVEKSLNSTVFCRT